LDNWRKIFGWRVPVEGGYENDEDFGKRRLFRAPYSETVWGFVYIKARCLREAQDVTNNGDWTDSEVIDADNFQISGPAEEA
jgi:hypothetical protein